MAENLWFFDHFNVENGGEESEARSYMNTFEARMVIGLTRHLVRQGYQPEQIAVLTPYQVVIYFFISKLLYIKICRTAPDVARVVDKVKHGNLH